MLAVVALLATQARVHPAFASDPAQEEAWYLEGRAMAKRGAKPVEYVKRWIKDMGKVRSPRNVKWQASSAGVVTRKLAFVTWGMDDERRYVPTAPALETIRKGSPPDRAVVFSVVLNAWPGVSSVGARPNRNAEEADVRNVSFVLLVDGDPEKALQPMEEPKMTEAKTVDGAATVPATNSVTFYDPSFNASTVTYATWQAEGYRAYHSQWAIRFPLYDASGRPTVPDTAKSIVLKVIRPKGELTRKVDLGELARL